MAIEKANILREVKPVDVPGERRDPLDANTLSQVTNIINDVRRRGDQAMREYAVRFGDREQDDPLVISRDELQQAFDDISGDQQQLLTRAGDRIRRFAEKQMEMVGAVTLPLAGGEAGHEPMPVEVAGCYVPGGRFPLPSTALMTAITARVAGVKTVWVASPKPTPITLAAARVAGADSVLAVGGAQAIAALAYGTKSIPMCDVIVGPGNRWVTAAKQFVAGTVAIDMIAGPSELVVFADDKADAHLVALDLLGQAEHDPDALPVLVTTNHALIDEVRERIVAILEQTPSESAIASLQNGLAIPVDDLQAGIDIINTLAPEHLQLSLEDPQAVRDGLVHYGALFIGENSAEVMGDYGAGPNHVLPTSGVARHTGGLSVLNFLRWPTWLRIDSLDDAQELIEDSVALARLEGLEFHARAAEARLRRK